MFWVGGGFRGVAYRWLKKGGVAYGSVAYSGEDVGIFWKDGYILGGSHF